MLNRYQRAAARPQSSALRISAPSTPRPRSSPGWTPPEAEPPPGRNRRRNNRRRSRRRGPSRAPKSSTISPSSPGRGRTDTPVTAVDFKPLAHPLRPPRGGDSPTRAYETYLAARRRTARNALRFAKTTAESLPVALAHPKTPPQALPRPLAHARTPPKGFLAVFKLPSGAPQPFPAPLAHARTPPKALGRALANAATPPRTLLPAFPHAQTAPKTFPQGLQNVSGVPEAL